MLTWINRPFQIRKTATGFMAHGTDDKGVIIFRWRMYYEGPQDEYKCGDESIYEDFNVPFGVIEEFETFTALCRQFNTPGDAEAWYLKRINRNARK